jgi:hypothetical protein
MVAYLLVAASGLLGRGPLARTQLRSSDGVIEATYDRVQRLGTESQLLLRIYPAHLQDGDLILRTSQPGERPRRISPEPAQRTPLPDGEAWHFGTPPGAGPVEIVAAVQPDSVGRFAITLSTTGGSTLQLGGFVVP